MYIIQFYPQWFYAILFSLSLLPYIKDIKVSYHLPHMHLKQIIRDSHAM